MGQLRSSERQRAVSAAAAAARLHFTCLLDHALVDVAAPVQSQLPRPLKGAHTMRADMVQVLHYIASMHFHYDERHHLA